MVCRALALCAILTVACTTLDPIDEAVGMGDLASTVAFQDGVAPSTAYAGTHDTYLAQAAPATSFATSTTVRADGDDGGGNDLAALLYFNVAGVVPAGSTVTGATLELTVTNPTAGSYEAYGLLRRFIEGEATWNQLAAGQPWQTPGAKGASDRSTAVVATVAPRATGRTSFQLTAAGIALVQRWLDDANANYGFIIANSTTTDGIAFTSSEATDPAARPRLTIQYTLASSSDGGTPIADSGSPSGTTWRWHGVRIGGGGYVTGVLVHPSADIVYARTDVGGAYRWDEASHTWAALLDWVTNGGWMGVAAMAVKPSSPDVVAFLVGRGSPMVLYSTNRGASFVQAITQAQASSIWPGDAVDGNSRDARWGGERLVIAPDGTLWVATRGQGLWKGTPASGSFTWARETISGVANTATVRALALASDGTLYAAVQDRTVFQRTTSGAWSGTGLDLSGPDDVIRLAAAGTTLYATTGTYSQLAPRAAGRVWKYSSGGWTNVTPSGVTAPDGWGSLTAVGSNVVVAGNLQTRPPVMLSTNAGGTWRRIGPQSDTERRAQLSGAPGWWPLFFFGDHSAGLALDPRATTRLWQADWYALWRTNDWTATAPAWVAEDRGHEESIEFHVDGLPGGGLLSGMADIGGFSQTNLDAFPSARDFSGWSEAVQGGYARSNPSIRYRTVTRDGAMNDVLRFDGTSWIVEAGYPDRLGYDLAISATSPDLVVVVAFGGKPLRRDPSTHAWATIESLGADDQAQQDIYQRDRPLEADAVNGSVFYFYDRGRLWVSEDGARTFAARGDALPSVSRSCVATAPGIDGEVWVALGTQGLHRFTSRGGAHQIMSGVGDARSIAFGARLAGTSRPALYLAGDAGAGLGIYVSSTVPPTWRKISDATVPMALYRSLGASPDVAGLVFVGSSGRGMLYGRLE